MTGFSLILGHSVHTQLQLSIADSKDDT